MGEIESVALTVVPAYGRDYKSASTAQADWWNGKDFAIVSVNHRGGTYVSCQDLEGKNYEITIRYGSLRKLTIVKNVAK